VTAFGRMMIELTKKHVEEMFTVSNGYQHDAQVSWPGSVMVCASKTSVGLASRKLRNACVWHMSSVDH